MTPEEFRQLYQERQEELGNRLQTLSTLNHEVNRLINQINQDYAHINALVEGFLQQQNSSKTDAQSELP